MDKRALACAAFLCVVLVCPGRSLARDAGVGDRAEIRYAARPPGARQIEDLPCRDEDGDGYGAALSRHCPQQGLDCNDGEPLVHPGAPEICNGIDDDCDGRADEEPAASVSCDDGWFCNGRETCARGACQAGTEPCPEDGLFCNGVVTCDEAGDRCVNPGPPCTDGSECTDDICNEAEKICEYPCLARDAGDHCCQDPACAGQPVCNGPWGAARQANAAGMGRGAGGASNGIGSLCTLFLPAAAVLAFKGLRRTRRS